ncbi:MAG TPA: HD domain-containing protein, partial [Sediminispirochaeta sp.]|nr:HD domain-containing protein [Sediminispirochaeta sp.]
MKQPWKRSAEAYSGVATSSIYLQNKPRILLLSDAGESDIPYKDRVDELYELTLLSRVEEYFRVEPEALLPDLIIYDYKKNTYDLLLHIRNYVRRHWKYKIPILIIQREPDEQLYGRLIDCGEMEILRAPFREEELIYRIGLHLKGLEKEVLEKRVDKLLDRLSESHLAMILALAELTESRDKSTGNHLQRIRSYSKLLARKLMERDLFPEIDADFLRHIYHMSALHDIGKVGIPDRILLKEGPLSSEERREMQEHSRIGGRTIEKVLRNYSISGGFEMARDIALYHHERWDGEGYP